MSERNNVYEIIKQNKLEILNEFVELIDKEPQQWHKGWNSSMVSPFNSLTNKYYSGGNILKAALKAKELESKDPRWLTFKQINDLGLKLKKGATSIKMEYWLSRENKLDDEKIMKLSEDELKRLENKINSRIDKGYFQDAFGNTIKKHINRNDEQFFYLAKLIENTPIPSYFNVFNGKEVEGLEEFKYPKIEESKLWDIADDLIKSCPVPVKEIAQGKAYNENFKGNTEHIILPPRETFKNANEYLATLLHEMGHNTGQKEDLNRQLGNKFGDLKYAKEELVAEFTSIIVQSRLGIDINQNSKNNHAAYLQGWSKVIREKTYDKDYKPENELFKALSEATKAAELILGRYKEKRKELGKEYVDMIGINSKDKEKTDIAKSNKKRAWHSKSNKENLER